MTSTPLPVFTVERESTELIVLDVKVDGQPVADYETQETAYSSYASTSPRPTEEEWADPMAADDVSGHLASPGEQGMSTVWVRYQANPEAPVRRVAHIRRV